MQVHAALGAIGQQFDGHRTGFAEGRVVHGLEFDDLAGLVPAKGDPGGQGAGYVLPILRGPQVYHRLGLWYR